VRDAMAKIHRDVNCVVGWRIPPEVFRRLPNLMWVQSISVGVEDWLPDAVLSPDVIVTNTKGIYADEIAEYIIWALMTLSRRLDVVIKNQGKRRWRQIFGTGVSGKTIGIVGLGHVGRATARLAMSLGMQVVGIYRDGSTKNDVGENTVAGSELDSVLDRLDVLAICLPLTEETRSLIGSDVIDGMKQGSILINVSRAAIIDYESLLGALKQGHLGGAALDVFDKEPLRRWSPLWKVPNLLITPHISALTHEYKAKVAGLVCDNLEKLRSGNKLECVVDRAKGY